MDTSLYNQPVRSRDIVDFLYELVLQRPAEEAAHAYWVGKLDTGTPILEVFQGLLKSFEFRATASTHPYLVQQPLAPGGMDVSRAGEDVFPLHVVDVGAQLLENEEHVYSRLLRAGPCRITGFEPISTALDERQAAEPNTTLLPYFLGDGETATFYRTADDTCASLYEPNGKVVGAYKSQIGENFRVVSTETVTTTRLDEAVPQERIDLLKVDVQGAELNVLHGATNALHETLVVHLEVAFDHMYVNQPLFAQVDEFLQDAGFELIDFASLHRYQYATKHPTGPTSSRLLWGDAIYVKQADLLAKIPRDLLATAFIMHSNYDKRDLAGHLLDVYDDIKGTDLAAGYAASLPVDP